MNALEREKAAVREAVKQQLKALGVAAKRADELVGEVEEKGWAWNPEPTADGAGVIVCACGAYAVVRDPKRFKPHPCPNCKQLWNLAEVQ